MVVRFGDMDIYHEMIKMGQLKVLHNLVWYVSHFNMSRCVRSFWQYCKAIRKVCSNLDDLYDCRINVMKYLDLSGIYFAGLAKHRHSCSVIFSHGRLLENKVR